MPLVSNIQSHDYRFALPTAKGVWRWSVRLDVSKSTPQYTVFDITSPFGILRDSIPLPGEVVTAMSDAIVELKANFAPTILLGSPSSLTFITDEGRGFYPQQSVNLTNSGVYGSLLDGALTTSASYVHVTPSSVGNLAHNETGSFAVSVDSTTLVATSSPYSATVTVVDPTATNTPQTFPITITVRPKAEITLSSALLTFTVVKPLSGAFPSIGTQTFDVQNTGDGASSLVYLVQKLTGLSDWLTTISPSGATLAGGTSQTTTLTVVPPDAMMWGTYTETLRVSGYSSNSYQDIQIQLIIT